MFNSPSQKSGDQETRSGDQRTAAIEAQARRRHWAGEGETEGCEDSSRCSNL